MAISFPGRTLRIGSADHASVEAVQQQLIAQGCGPAGEPGVFGEETDRAVRIFQTRFPALDGSALNVDGMIGPVTWGALFGSGDVPLASASGLGDKALAEAIKRIGVMEDPPKSNAGPEVKQYLASVGLGTGFAWCAAFVYFCTQQAAQGLGVANPLPKTAGVLNLWAKAPKAGLQLLSAGQVAERPGLLAPGAVFIMNMGSGQGHTGFVEGMANGRLVTVEGNSNTGGSREGVGVFRLQRRPLASINEGFILLP